MARLPGYENTKTVETGSQFMRPRSSTDQTSRALQDLGSTIGQIGARLQAADDRLNAKLEAEAKRSEALQIESDVIRTDTDERLRWQDYRNNAPESGVGIYDGFMKDHDKVWQDRVAAMPIERRDAAQVKFLRNRESMATEVAGFEHQQRNKFIGTVAKEKDVSLTTGIKVGTMDHTTASGEINTFVDSLALPPNRADVLKRSMGMSVDGARIEREIATNAPGALRDMTRYAAGSQTSTNPHVQRIVEAANRHGVPLNVILSGVAGESNFDPTVDMSKRINPKTGRPYSTASGYGQLLDSNWAEVGMSKSADPDVQAEATARLFKQRVDYLQRNGIEASPANVAGAHLVGPGTYAAMLRADPNTPLRDIMLPRYGANKYAQATTGNGKLLVDGATVGQTLTALRERSAKNETAAAALVTASAGGSGPVTVGGTTLQYMTSADLPRYIARAQAAAAEQSDAALVEAAKAKVSSGPINSYDPAHRSDADKAFKADGVGSAIIQGDADAVGRSQAFARINGFLPQDASASAQKLMVSPDSVERVKGYELGLTAHAADPINGLQFSRFDADMQKRIRLYATIREADGIEPVEATRRVEAILSPDNQKRSLTEEFRKTVKEKRESMTFSDLVSVSDMRSGFAITRMFGYGVDRTPQSDKVQNFMLDRFRDSFEEYAKMYGNVDAAVTAAKSDMKRMIGVTRVFGVEQATLFPVERMVRPMPDGTHTWVANQAMLLVSGDSERATREKDVPYGTINPKNLVLKPTANTWLDVRAGRPPEYDLIYIDKANSMVREVRLGWRPDYSAAHEAYRNDVETQEYGPRSSGPAPKPAPTGKLGVARKKQADDAAVVDNDRTNFALER